MDKSVNKSHPKATSAEEKAKQHLISVGLYGRSVSIISNAFRLTSIIRSYAEKHVFKEWLKEDQGALKQHDRHVSENVERGRRPMEIAAGRLKRLHSSIKKGAGMSRLTPSRCEIFWV